MVTRATILCLVAFSLGACVQGGIEDGRELPQADEHFFRCNVQPVLAARCAFMACHGNLDRPLPIYAEQRLRIDITWREYDTPLTDEELARNFDTVRGFIARNPGETQLLSEKPLDVRAGGLYHQGEELDVTEDVFVSRDDPGYQILRDFTSGATAAPDCIPTREVGL